MESRQINVDIDFDSASRQWRKNKISKVNGTFSYRCMATTKSNEDCKNKAISTIDYCFIHRKLTQEKPLQ